MAKSSESLSRVPHIYKGRGPAWTMKFFEATTHMLVFFTTIDFWVGLFFRNFPHELLYRIFLLFFEVNTYQCFATLIVLFWHEKHERFFFFKFLTARQNEMKLTRHTLI